ncbi:MAG: histidine phosphatase family protein [Acidimicrobiia bacterium]|nr:histidine phosphatase family protein [Acidimicrobiia bacterium]
MQKALGKPFHLATVAPWDTQVMHIHLIRHGEVENPGDIVYGDIPGFVLSPHGRQQAKAAGRYLAPNPPTLIVSSPLDRAVETAGLIAAATGARTTTDVRLTEWFLAVRWRGATWSQLPTVFPGELEAYLADPRHLPFCDESIDLVADRFTAAVAEHVAGADGDVAFVSHEDSLHAAHNRLVGRTPEVFHANKPTHCSVTTLQRTNDGWADVVRWEPAPTQQ